MVDAVNPVSFQPTTDGKQPPLLYVYRTLAIFSGYSGQLVSQSNSG